MKLRTALALCAATAVTVSVARAEENIQLPPEVTPALRAACEGDVRRYCVGANPTMAKVKACVYAKYTQFGKRCQVQMALAGFKR
jgi:hypothetical protein